jgi:hypothetical protein
VKTERLSVCNQWGQKLNLGAPLRFPGLAPPSRTNAGISRGGIFRQLLDGHYVAGYRSHQLLVIKFYSRLPLGPWSLAPSSVLARRS